MDSQETSDFLAVERRDDVVVARFHREVVLSGHEAEAAAVGLGALLDEPDSRPLLVDFGNGRSLSSIMLGKLIG